MSDAGGFEPQVEDDDDPTGMKAIIAMPAGQRAAFLSLSATLQGCVLALDTTARKKGAWISWKIPKDGGADVSGQCTNHAKRSRKIAEVLRPVAKRWRQKVALLKLVTAQSTKVLQISPSKFTSRQPKVFVYESGTKDMGGGEWVEAEVLIECYLAREAAEGYDQQKGGSGAQPILFPWQKEKEDAQDSADIWLHYAFKSHPLRTYDPEEADIFFVPFLLRISHAVGDKRECAGTKSHAERVSQFETALESSPFYKRKHGRDHLFVCQSWECASYMCNSRIPKLLQQGLLAMHERNQVWSCGWNSEQVSRCACE
jgi:hypothetical protein